jgi:hypothetical protein
MRNPSKNRVLRRAWTAGPSNGESASSPHLNLTHNLRAWHQFRGDTQPSSRRQFPAATAVCSSFEIACQPLRRPESGRQSTEASSSMRPGCHATSPASSSLIAVIASCGTRPSAPAIRATGIRRFHLRGYQAEGDRGPTGTTQFARQRERWLAGAVLRSSTQSAQERSRFEVNDFGMSVFFRQKVLPIETVERSALQSICG